VRTHAAILVVGAFVVLLIGVAELQQVMAAYCRIQASARVAEVGVDAQGYWFVRIEVTNTGTLPWRAVMVSNPGLLANSPPSLEVGSTLPSEPIPGRFDFVLETVDEGVVPNAPGAVTFDLGIVSAEPWFLWTPKVGAWPYALSL
jgi:hypothetical protein